MVVGHEGGSHTETWSSCGTYCVEETFVKQLMAAETFVKQLMAAVSGHGSPTSALQRSHSLNCDITRSAKYPPEKQSTLDSRDTVWIGLECVAIVLCNKIHVQAFPNPVTIVAECSIRVY